MSPSDWKTKLLLKVSANTTLLATRVVKGMFTKLVFYTLIICTLTPNSRLPLKQQTFSHWKLK